VNQETIFHDARTKPAAERAAFLEGACAGDADLRRRVDSLLDADDNPAGFLGKPAVNPATSCEGVGSRIGPYTLMEPLGEGGMGTVFRAEQSHPVRRTVALKIIKPGMGSRQVSARFEAERQALALMDHANIARVLDAGTTDGGRPYFVMELVDGVPITRYCDEQRLTPRQRLELLLPVCRAVQHAHQKGLIHRDLKPSNVLVATHDGRPVPKVIDFGIAKATAGQSPAGRSMFTQLGSVIGTVEYMSPEQAGLGGRDVDTRSDVYSLGVLLYELLTGTTPLEAARVKTAALLEVLRLVREEEAPRPSTRLSAIAQLSSVAASRGLEPRKLTGLVRGELDWIVMKALEKDRARRYETANGLARDIERYLANEPVQACPASPGYQLRKYVRRHKGPVAAAALVVLALLGGLAGTGWQAVRANRQAVRADAERALAVAERNEKRAALEAETAAREQVMDTLRSLTDNVVVWRLSQGPGLGPTERLFLRRIAAHHEAFAALKGPGPESRFISAEGHLRVGFVRARIKDHAEALASYGRAAENFDQLARDFPAAPDYRRYLAATHVALADVLGHLGKAAGSEAALKRAVELRLQLPHATRGDPDHRRYFVGDQESLRRLLTFAGNPAAALAEERALVDLREQLAREFPADTDQLVSLARSHCELGILLWLEGDVPAAVSYFGKSIDALDPVMALGESRPVATSSYLCDSHYYRARAAWALGDFAVAAAAWGRAAAVEDGPRGPEFRFQRAVCLARVHPAEAVSAAAEFLAGDPDDLERTSRYAPILLMAGDHEGYGRLCALQLRREPKLKCLEVKGRKDILLARLCLLNPETDTAEPSRLAERALNDGQTSALCLHTMGFAHYRSRSYDKAVPLLEAALADETWGGRPVNRLVLAMAYHAQDRQDDARRTLREATGPVDALSTRAVTGLNMHVHDWLAWQLLRSEAEALIGRAGK
jgi:serine/threonine protein kinase